jgi:hypothetical protein
MNSARRWLNSKGSGARRVLAAALLVLGVLLGLACGQNGAPEGAIASPVEVQVQKPATDSRFLGNLPKTLQLPAADDEVGWRVLADYGAIFVARGRAIPPPCIVFPDEQAVTEWQSSLKIQRLELDGIAVELQAPAAEALLAARREARAQGLDISPRSRDAARRSYQDTRQLWASRVNPGLEHWVSARRLTKRESDRIRTLPLRQQVPEILRLEKQKIFFSKDFSKSILYSVAAPGTSQHISMLALDVKEHATLPVRALLARHGWYQTVVSDLPHFTFLGVAEEELPALGLKKVQDSGRAFWIPDLEATAGRQSRP